MEPALEASRPYVICKRVFDTIVAGSVLLLCLPLMGCIALAIYLDMGRPVLFKQDRVGRHLVLFTFYKFRTFRREVNGRMDPVDGRSFQESRYKSREDSQHSRLTRMLRRSSLDELPNLWNVLRGEMSIVGPRPELPRYIEFYEAWQLSKFDVLPGVTGLSQVSGRNDLTAGEAISLDVAYVARQCFSFDLAIILRTVRAVITSRGAY